MCIRDRSTTMLEFLSPGNMIMVSSPLYGGTDHFVNHFLTKIGVSVLEFKPKQSFEEMISLIENSGRADKLAMIFMETPANPTNALIDIEMCKKIADKYSCLLYTSRCV